MFFPLEKIRTDSMDWKPREEPREPEPNQASSTAMQSLTGAVIQLRDQSERARPPQAPTPIPGVHSEQMGPRLSHDIPASASVESRKPQGSNYADPIQGVFSRN